jgi:hypothetical protein
VLEAPFPGGRDGAIDAARAGRRRGNDAAVGRVEAVRYLHHQSGREVGVIACQRGIGPVALDQIDGVALKELLKKKQSGEKIEAPRERAPAKVINLMDALRRSVETERGGGERRKPESHAATRPRAAPTKSRSSARQKRRADVRPFATRACLAAQPGRSGMRRRL